MIAEIAGLPRRPFFVFLACTVLYSVVRTELWSELYCTTLYSFHLRPIDQDEDREDVR
jgi:hypothetical protein